MMLISIYLTETKNRVNWERGKMSNNEKPSPAAARRRLSLSLDWILA